MQIQPSQQKCSLLQAIPSCNYYLGSSQYNMGDVSIVWIKCQEVFSRQPTRLFVQANKSIDNGSYFIVLVPKTQRLELNEKVIQDLVVIWCDLCYSALQRCCLPGVFYVVFRCAFHRLFCRAVRTAETSWSACKRAWCNWNLFFS